MISDGPPGDDCVPDGASVPGLEANHILRVIPESERRVLASDATLLEVPRHEILVSPGEPGRFVYFPIEGLLALQITDSDGNALTIDVLGRDGLLGLWTHLETATTPYLAVTLSVMRIWRVSATTMRRVAHPGSMLAWVLGRYAQLLLVQRAVLMSCHRSHSLRERVARFVCVSSARAASTHLSMTHEDIADGAGAHRPAVTEALHDLAQAGVIAMSRGQVTITDRDRLRTYACPCCETIHRLDEEFARISQVS